MKFNIGDRVYWYPKRRCINQDRVLTNVSNVNTLRYIYWDYEITLEGNKKIYVLEEELDIDKEYYREIKINSLL